MFCNPNVVGGDSREEFNKKCRNCCFTQHTEIPLVVNEKDPGAPLTHLCEICVFTLVTFVSAHQSIYTILRAVGGDDSLIRKRRRFPIVPVFRKNPVHTLYEVLNERNDILCLWYLSSSFRTSTTTEQGTNWDSCDTVLYHQEMENTSRISLWPFRMAGKSYTTKPNWLQEKANSKKFSSIHDRFRN